MTVEQNVKELSSQPASFWERFGKWIAAAVLASAVGVGGYQYYQYKTEQTQLEAAQLFDRLEELSAQNDHKKMRDVAGQLMSKYDDTAFAAKAALIVAKSNVDHQDVKSAIDQLNWVTAHSQERALVAMAKLNLASIYLDQKSYTEALKQVEEMPDNPFAAFFADTRGDIYTIQSNKKLAKKSYQTALDLLGPNSQYRELIQIKLDNLGDEA